MEIESESFRIKKDKEKVSLALLAQVNIDQEDIFKKSSSIVI